MMRYNKSRRKANGNSHSIGTNNNRNERDIFDGTWDQFRYVSEEKKNCEKKHKNMCKIKTEEQELAVC